MNNKYLFAHYLRAIAVISVILTHYGTAFFNNNVTLSSMVNVPPLIDTTYPKLVEALAIPPSLPAFMAVFGVSVFFLISGFVIPMSIERYGLFDFLIKRFFRLYPTYITVLLINAVVAIVGLVIFYHTGLRYAYSGDDIFFTAFMGLNNIIGHWMVLDPVAWTLAIELIFYFIAAFMFSFFFKLKSERIISWWQIIIIAFIINLTAIKISKYSEFLSSHFSFVNVAVLIKSLYLIAFMFIGTTFFIHAKKKDID